MDIYTYIATSNPYGSRAILHKYGYGIRGVSNAKDLGKCLQQLVQKEGESAFYDVLDHHPDKELLAEYQELKQAKKEPQPHSNACGCGGTAYMNFAGAMQTAASTNQNNSSREFSGYIIAAALILGAAIIAKN